MLPALYLSFEMAKQSYNQENGIPVSIFVGILAILPHRYLISESFAEGYKIIKELSAKIRKR